MTLGTDVDPGNVGRFGYCFCPCFPGLIFCQLIVRALALREVALGDWWRIAMRELPAAPILGAILGIIGVARIALWQFLGFYDYGPHWSLIAATVASALIGVVTFGS